FQLVKHEALFSVAANQASDGIVQGSDGLLNLHLQARNAGTFCCVGSAGERLMRRVRPQAPYGDSCNHQVMRGGQRRRQAGLATCAKRTLSVVDAPNEKQASGFEISRMSRVDVVTVALERLARRVQCPGVPAQV